MGTITWAAMISTTRSSSMCWSISSSSMASMCPISPRPWRASCAAPAKKHLSDHPYARIEEEYIAASNGKPVHLALELSRHDYQDMIAPFLQQTLGAAHIALESASLTASRIDEILLVGGATRTPLVHHRLAEAFSKDPRCEVN